MSGILDGLNAEPYDRQYSNTELLRRIVRHLGSVRGLLFRLVILLLCSTALSLLVPYAVSQALTRSSRLGHGPVVFSLVLAVALAGGLSWMLQYLERLGVRRAMAGVVFSLQEQSFDSALRQDASFYADTTHGKLVARVTGDTQAFSLIVTLSLSVLSQGVLVVGVLIMLWTVNALLAAAMTLLIPVVLAVALAFRRWARVTTQRTQRAAANVNSAIGEALGGMAVAKNFGQESLLLQEFREVNGAAFRLQVQQGMVFSAIYPILGVLTGLAELLVAYLGGRAVLSGQLNIGQWYLFVQALDYFIFPLTSVAAFWSQFQQGLGAAERVFALMDQPGQKDGGIHPLPSAAACLEMREVDFAYPNGTMVLNGFSLTLQPGETVALVGETGSGKSTVARLLTGQYRAARGQLLIDGLPIEAYDPQHLRGYVGYVSQEPFLFADTVLNNILLGRPGAAASEAERVARTLLPGWTEQLPQGLGTQVGERGTGISLGQRQLVVLARILLQNPPVLILDEATANIDPWTELQLLQALATVQRGRTCLLVAHRQGTIAHAERVVQLQGGRAVLQGGGVEAARG